MPTPTRSCRTGPLLHEDLTPASGSTSIGCSASESGSETTCSNTSCPRPTNPPLKSPKASSNVVQIRNAAAHSSHWSARRRARVTPVEADDLLQGRLHQPLHQRLAHRRTARPCTSRTTCVGTSPLDQRPELAHLHARSLHDGRHHKTNIDDLRGCGEEDPTTPRSPSVRLSESLEVTSPKTAQ
jgi:hypothetical protein